MPFTQTCVCDSLSMRAVAGVRMCLHVCVCEHVIACMCLRVCLCLPFDCHLNLWHVQQSYEAADRQERVMREKKKGKVYVCAVVGGNRRGEKE